MSERTFSDRGPLVANPPPWAGRGFDDGGHFWIWGIDDHNEPVCIIIADEDRDLYTDWGAFAQGQSFWLSKEPAGVALRAVIEANCERLSIPVPDLRRLAGPAPPDSYAPDPRYPTTEIANKAGLLVASWQPPDVWSSYQLTGNGSAAERAAGWRPPTERGAGRSYVGPKARELSPVWSYATDLFYASMKRGELVPPTSGYTIAPIARGDDGGCGVVRRMVKLGGTWLNCYVVPSMRLGMISDRTGMRVGNGTGGSAYLAFGCAMAVLSFAAGAITSGVTIASVAGAVLGQVRMWVGDAQKSAQIEQAGEAFGARLRKMATRQGGAQGPNTPPDIAAAFAAGSKSVPSSDVLLHRIARRDLGQSAVVGGVGIGALAALALL